MLRTVYPWCFVCVCVCVCVLCVCVCVCVCVRTCVRMHNTDEKVHVVWGYLTIPSVILFRPWHTGHFFVASKSGGCK